MRGKARFERDPDGWWWANQNVGEDNVLGRGITKEEALVDLEHQLASFVDFLKRTGKDIPRSLR